MKKVIFIIGVSGSGKSTIGELLSQDLRIPFFDGDDYHSKANIAKLSKGVPLNDEDRYDWLFTLNGLAKKQLLSNDCIIACSALKKSYREILSTDIKSQVKWVHLAGSFEQISERLGLRENHFMNPALLQSQFDTLEHPDNAITISIGLNPAEIVKRITNEVGTKSEFGLFGLGVMGKSLSRNLANNGFKISIFNREVLRTEENVAVNFKSEYKELETAQAFSNIEEFVNSLQTPRKILLMVNAGKIVDSVIEDIVPFLSDGDILIDGGNSNYLNTKERNEFLKSKSINFIGMGISGGEEGALKGPSMMPGGDKETYKLVQPFLDGIAAKDENNFPCCSYIGEGGSGHFVKMVHNGIEYVEMQLLAEVYGILSATGKNPDEIADILETWKNQETSYLIEITISILRKKENNDWLINKILDKAGNKGTGNWSAIAAAQLGVPTTLITSALFSRYLSFFKSKRLGAAKAFKTNHEVDIHISLTDLQHGYQFARIMNHYQGFDIISQASDTYNWNLNLSEIARIWTNGCIIKSDFMIQLVSILKKDPNILNHVTIIEQINALRQSIKTTVSECILNEIPISCLSESLNFFNSYKTANSTANLIQAQRDYFGAHRYQKVDDISETFYHTNWEN